MAICEGHGFRRRRVTYALEWWNQPARNAMRLLIPLLRMRSAISRCPQPVEVIAN
jgi:hypothetical protein